MAVEDNLLRGAEASKNSTIVLIFLAALKGIVGFHSGSSALIADAIHTSLDIFTSLAVWIGLKLSCKNSVENFPYGYYKAENLVALFVSTLILFSGFELMRGAITSINQPVELEIQGLAIATAIFSVMAIFALSKYKLKIGKTIGSPALVADAMHSYTDVFSSLIVVVSITGSMLGFPWFNSMGVLLISLLIFKLGFSIVRDSVLALMDAWVDREMMGSIRSSIEAIQGVNRVEDIRLRKSGIVVFGEVTFEISGEHSLKRVEIVSREVEDAVKKHVNNVEHLIINAKPAEMSSLRVAIPVISNEGTRSELSRHFGKAEYYICIDMEKDGVRNWDLYENPGSGLEKKRGVKTAEFLIANNINALVVSGIGEGPFHVLHDSFVKILQMPSDAKIVADVMGRIMELDIVGSPTE